MPNDVQIATPAPEAPDSRREYEVVGSNDEGLDLDWKANRFQGMLVLATSLAGSVIGAILTYPMPLAGILAGFVFGMIVGTLVSGSVLLKQKPEHTYLDLNQYFRERRLLHHRTIRAMIFGGVVLIVFAFGFPELAFNDSPWAFVTCILLIMFAVGACAYIKGLAAFANLKLRCPQCGQEVAVGEDDEKRHCTACDYRFS